MGQQQVLKKALQILTLQNRSQVLVVLISLSFGLWFITPHNVWPTSVDWLNYGDMAFMQHAWQYFRYTPLLQWPITEITAAGDGWGSINPSIAFLGLPLKFISPTLPTSFQYLGLWTLANFGLQGFFAERLFFRLGLREIERILGAISILIAPAFIFRIRMTHLELAAHWLIIAALLVYVSDGNSRVIRKVYSLSLLTLLVNLYLFVMVFSIALITLAKPLFSDGKDLRKLRTIVLQIAGLTSLSGITFWALGYLTYQSSSSGVGFFRLNALAFFNPGFNPTDSFSSVLDRVPSFTARQFFAEEGEGFGYLGLVGVIGIMALIFSIPRWLNRRNLQVFAPLIGVAVFLFAVALSDRVAIVRREIQLPIPQVLVDVRQVFRAATRFSWVAYYLLLVLGWIAICKLTRRARIAAIALPLILVLGVVDQWGGVTKSRAMIVEERRQSTFRSVEWENVGRSATKMYLVPTFDIQADDSAPIVEAWLADSRWADLIAFGAEHQLITNFTYSARPVTRQVELANAQLSEMLRQRKIPRSSILFFALKSDWLVASKSLRPGDIAKSLDGYFIIVAKE